MAGGGSSGTTTTHEPYSRQGSTTNSESYGFGPSLSGVITDNLNSTSAAGAPVKNFLSGLVSYDPSVPGFNGNQAAAQINPFTSAYESSTDALYQNRLQNALALSKSGPDNVMAPLARGDAFKQSETLNEYGRGRNREIRDERNVDAGIMFKGVEDLIGQRLQAAGLFPQLKYSDNAAFQTAATLLGPKVATVAENAVGEGTQATTAHSFGAGANICCFIFLEALNGSLPACVRKGRDEHAKGAKRLGYIRMAKWLVPAMRLFSPVKHLVNLLMVKPFIREGERVYENKFTWRYFIDRPICWTWYRVWETYGR